MDKIPEVLGGCIGIIYTLAYRVIVIHAAIKYIRS